MKKTILLCAAFLVALALGIVIFVFTRDSVGDPVGNSVDEVYGFYGNNCKVPLYKSKNIAIDLPLTYEATVYFDEDYDNTQSGGVIFGNYSESTKVCTNFEIYTGGVPRLYIVDSNAKVYDLQFTDVNVFTGEPVHIAITLDKESNTSACYVNGELKQSISNEIPDSVTLPSSYYILGGDFRTNNEQSFKGIIQQLALFNDTRNAKEVAKDYKLRYKQDKLSTDNLLTCYDFRNSRPLPTYTPAAGTDFGFTNPNDNLSFWLEESTVPGKYDYSFAVLGDVQTLTRYYPKKLENLYDYIIENKDSKNIKYVIGLGDLVDSYSKRMNEWDRIKEQVIRLNGVLPYSIVRGNHDAIESFEQYFPLSEFKDTVTGSYNETSMTNTYHKFTVNGLNYMILCLEAIEVKDENVIAWANQLIADHPDYNVIVTTHIYLDPYGLYAKNKYGGFTGQELWDKLVSKHENIVLMLCGHEPTDDIVVQNGVGENGNIVPQILIDPQESDKSFGGLGMISMFYFSEGGSKLEIDYYSTARKAYFKEKNQFALSLSVVQPDGTIVAPKKTK